MVSAHGRLYGSGWLGLGAFLGAAEFAVEFGNYDVEITVPADHIVAATGELQNPQDVLTPQQRQRLVEARGAEGPILIVQAEEAAKAQENVSEETATWVNSHFCVDSLHVNRIRYTSFGFSILSPS